MTPVSKKHRWPPERAAEIKATKEKLRVAERQRALGVSPRMAWKWNPGYDSWQVDPEDE